MTMNLNNKKIVITGAASGIGHALLAELIQQEGVEVLATDLNPYPSTLPSNVQFLQQDIASAEGVDALFDAALAQMGKIDVFIANAGFAYYEQTQEENWQHIDKIYRCNTFSPIYASHKMARINQGREYGVLITASFMGIYSLPGYSLYSSTKAALLSWADAYHREKQDQGHIMMLCPVATKTHFFDTQAPVPWPSQNAQAVAKAAIHGIRTNKQRIYPSQLSKLTLALNWIFPIVMPIYKWRETQKFFQWLTQKSRD